MFYAPLTAYLQREGLSYIHKHLMSSEHFSWLTGKLGNRNARKKQPTRLDRRMTIGVNGNYGGQTRKVFSGDIAVL